MNRLRSPFNGAMTSQPRIPLMPGAHWIKDTASTLQWSHDLPAMDTQSWSRADEAEHAVLRASMEP